jgi:hypothetical protein
MAARHYHRCRGCRLIGDGCTGVCCKQEIRGDAQRPYDPGADPACPSGQLGNIKVSPNVAAGFTNSGNMTDYRFISLTNEGPVNGVPGLIKYCVYPNPAQQPTAIIVQAKGADGSPWIALSGSKSFAFSRQFGDLSNIPLNASGTVVMGTATWSGTTAPSNQTIILHINDPKVCASLGLGATTCFVKPSEALACNAGAGSNVAAYNAYPFSVVDCGPPSEAFEAQQTAEFGDRVDLAGGAGQKLAALNVDFQSYGCSVSGHWYSSDCVTTPGATFTHPITANIYWVKTTGCPAGTTVCPDTKLATVTVTQTIPYRPSADNTNCTGANAGMWFNPVSGLCKNSIGIVLTFPFPAGPTLPAEVIWTVAFDTTHYGYNPIGEGASCFVTAVGCPYDSLNVGTESFQNAPYAGVDVVEDEAFRSFSPTNMLQQESGWTGFRPLGQIITTP